MKFLSAFVILAVAIAAEGHILPLAAWGHPAAILGHPGLTIAGPAVLGTSIVSAGGLHSLSSTNVISHHLAAPAIIAAHHVPAAHIAVAHHGHSGSYLAANRGSVHSAPLPGHATSAQSLNLEPAPGTL